MTIAALLVFGTLLATWLAVPAERRRHAEPPVPRPMAELASEAQAA
jgi:hypothetical protein